MRVSGHRLFKNASAVRYEETPNKGAAISPLYLIVHYTAGPSLESSVQWFKNRAANASAHLVIGRDGTIVQMVPFNRKAWHAGRSRWGELRGLNSYSIGIELDNAGKLQRLNNQWAAWFGQTYPDKEVMEAVHKHESTLAGWHVFPELQLQAAIEASIALHERYNFADVLGHDDVSPGRKTDPGPSFPTISFRSRVLGRSG